MLAFVSLALHERLKKQTVRARLLHRLLGNGLQRVESSVMFAALALDLRFDVLALLLLESHDGHVLLLRCVLHADVVLIVVEAPLEAGTVKNFLTFFGVHLRGRRLYQRQLHVDPLAKDRAGDNGGEEEDGVDGEFARLILDLLLQKGVAQHVIALGFLLNLITCISQLSFSLLEVLEHRLSIVKPGLWR